MNLSEILASYMKVSNMFDVDTMLDEIPSGNVYDFRDKFVKLMHKIETTPKISKSVYDYYIKYLEGASALEKLCLDQLIYLQEDELNNLKRHLHKQQEVFEQLIPMTTDTIKMLNNKYLDTGGKLSQLALNKLPNTLDGLHRSIEEGVSSLGLTEEELNAHKEAYMSAIKTVAKGRGGRRTRRMKKYRNRHK